MEPNQNPVVRLLLKAGLRTESSVSLNDNGTIKRFSVGLEVGD